MGYLAKGYWIVYLSPVLSLLLFFFFAGSFSFAFDWYSSLVFFASIQILVICVQVLGITFCLIGFRKNEPLLFSMPVSIFLSILLALWGGFTILIALGFYQDLLRWSSMPEVRSLIVWDYLLYVAWGLKGLLWVLAGMAFTITALIKKRPIRVSQI